MAQTDLDRAIDRINNTPGLSAAEKQQLRQEARGRANANGSMGAGDRQWLNNALTTTPAKNPGKGGGGNSGGNNGGNAGGGGGGGGGGTATTFSCEEKNGAAPTGKRWVGSYIVNPDGSVSNTCQLVDDGSQTMSCEDMKGAAPKGKKWVGSFVQNADGSISDTCRLVDDASSSTEDPMAGQRENAKTFMRNIMESLGFSTNFGFSQQEINTLFGKMDEWITAGYADYDRSGESLLLLFRTDKATSGIYNKRFPGMAALTSRGQAISESEYIRLEKSYRDVLSSYNLPKKYYDSFDDYGRFIAGDVSAQEVEERVIAAKNAANPAVMKELQQYYGIGEETATAYLLGLTDEKGIMLDAAAAARSQEEIRKASRNAQIGGMAEASGFNMDLASASALSGTTVGSTVDPFSDRTLAQLQGTFDQARRVANRETVLSGIDQEAYTEQDTLLAAFGDEKKKLASEARAKRERARFSGSSGVGGSSLSVSRNL